MEELERQKQSFNAKQAASLQVLTKEQNAQYQMFIVHFQKLDKSLN